MSEIPMNSPDVRTLVLQCSECDRYWRADQPERCVYCAREYGTPYFLDTHRRLELFQAIQTIPLDTVVDIENAQQFAEALAYHCEWYDQWDPIFVQACWLAIQEHCPWASSSQQQQSYPRAQEKWDELLGEGGAKPIPVADSQITYAALFFMLDFQDAAAYVDELNEDPQERWAAYLEDRVELYGI
jgi:hypothetical protein